MLEIERKFLVVEGQGTPWRTLSTSHTHICQGYMQCEGATVRIRTRQAEDADGRVVQEKAYLTIKGPSQDGGLSRFEFEREITLDEARQMLKLCRGGLIDKTRWIVPTASGHKWEVDEFHGLNDGLIVAEVELKSADEAFDRPDFLATEVTGQRKYYNSHLLVNPYSRW